MSLSKEGGSLSFFSDEIRRKGPYGQELKNLIVERMNQYVKDRVECFDDPFPCMKEEDCDKEHVSNWVRVFRDSSIDLLSKEILT